MHQLAQRLGPLQLLTACVAAVGALAHPPHRHQREQQRLRLVTAQQAALRRTCCRVQAGEACERQQAHRHRL